MSFLAPEPQIIQAPAPAPEPEAPPPVAAQAPRGSRPRRRAQQPTFLGEATAPPASQPTRGGGANTLLGQ